MTTKSPAQSLADELDKEFMRYALVPVKYSRSYRFRVIRLGQENVTLFGPSTGGKCMDWIADNIMRFPIGQEIEGAGIIAGVEREKGN